MTHTTRHIVHMDLDAFFVSVERLENTKLRNKPVIIGGMSDRGVVASCSYEARRFGVHSAMPMRMARRLCKDAVVIKGDMEKYSYYSHMVSQIIEEEAPAYEKASIDEHYLDITGMDKFFGCLKWSRELRQRIIRETGLPISFGLAANKTVSKIATTEAKPNGTMQVRPGEVHPFLDPLSIAKIPMIGDKTFQLLRSMGVGVIQTLRQMPVEMVEQVLGKNGRMIWKRANGWDETPVRSYSERKSVSTEHTFQQDVADTTIIEQVLVKMVEKLGFQLRSRRNLTSCVTIKIRYSNFDTHTLQKRIHYTSFDHELIVVAHELFRKLYQRRLRIRLIGVRLSHLIQGVQQLNLFDDTPQLVNLYGAMDYLRKRFGEDVIGRG